MFGVDDVLIAAFAEAAPEIFAEEAGSAAAADAAQFGIGEAATGAAPSAEMGTAAAGLRSLPPAQQAYLAASQASAGQGITQGVQPYASTMPQITTPPNVAAQMGLSQGSAPEMADGMRGFKATPSATSAMTPSAGAQYGLTSPSVAPGQMLPSSVTQAAEKSWWDSLSPFQKGMTAFAGTSALARLGAFGSGTPPALQPYSGPLSKYSLSPNFQPQVANPAQFQYTPRRYAEGGIADVQGYAKGGNLSEAMDFYKMMTTQTQNIPEGRHAPSAGVDTGIYYDTDPDTQRLDALTAAQIRQAKINKRVGLQGQSMQRPTGLGQLNMAPIGVKQGQDQQYQDMTAAQGGIMQAYAGGGPVEQMSDANAIGANTGFPMANIQRGAYATPYQQPISQNVITGTQDTRVDPYTGEEKFATGGGISSLGSYAAGGNPRLLKGPGDGMSDNIPAVIGNKQPARLADGEFVIPADVVSHLGNGSTDAGANKLHKMMTNVRKARTGNPKQGKQINPDKYMPK